MTFDWAKRTLTIRIDFTLRSRFADQGVAGVHPVHDVVAKPYRRLNLCHHECFLEARVPRVKLPNGGVGQVEPTCVGKSSRASRSSSRLPYSPFVAR